MKRKRLLVGLACAVALVFAVGVHGDAAGEIGRLAELMGWKAGTIVADIGAGDGAYAFAAAGLVGPKEWVFFQGSLTARLVEDWPEGSYCVVFGKK